MIVTFVSQCEKNALNKTRKVLDAFANRIGDKTWQTVITQEGLNAVQRLLRRTASKNTAVSCHRVRGNSRTELVWIVGKRQKFNALGLVPVNTTRSNIINNQLEDDWHYMELIKALTALAGLFHDWGKATLCFQKKLTANKPIGDPLRHEWISCLLLHALIKYSGNQTRDEDWLAQLSIGNIAEEALTEKLCNIKTPLADLPHAASLIAWLVLSHHRLPLPANLDNVKGLELADFKKCFNLLKANFGYENKFDLVEYEKALPTCFTFPHGLLSQSSPWLKQLKKWSTKLQKLLPLVEQSFENGCWRLILHHCRLSLMLGDHFYSSQNADPKWSGEATLFANTDRSSGQLKQKLDEHLVNVAQNALHITHLLPAFEKKLPVAQDLHKLKKRSPDNYAWQDKAVREIKNWRSKSPDLDSLHPSAFFAVNMASTGCGKTIANAKVMRALSDDYNSLRYILALGLRTLTLQTGDEYRERIGMDDTELAVMIGSKAVIELHKIGRQAVQQTSANYESSGSESLEPLLDGEISFDAVIPEDRFSTVFRTDQYGERNRKFLYAPVLACTIDHIMAATETRRGGRYILPCLRLMSSDLVIDEIDDFDNTDLIAIGRLIHLAGMLGRKVMISSATIPPDLAEGYFNAYREGWSLFSKTRNVSTQIGCAWIDEFKTQVETIVAQNTEGALEKYRKTHRQFVAKRIIKLSNKAKNPIRCKATVVDCEKIHSTDLNETIESSYFTKIRETIIEQHCLHHTVDHKTQKRVSFGVIRIAHIEPCIALADFLIQTEWEQNVAPKIMAYHSRQVMLLRSDQEKHLDQVLKRKEIYGEQPEAFSHPIIRQHIEECDAQDIVFIVVATPVEEIGRDHDFDWAIIEPSSFRSIIQLAGRVMRHRKYAIDAANIALMQYNLKAFKGADLAYCHPGYEQSQANHGGQFKLRTHDLKVLLTDSGIETSLNAIPRIQKNSELKPQERLADLEHQTIAFLLTSYERLGPEALQGWLTQYWWLTAIPQKLNPFRKSTGSLQLFRIWEDGELVFKERDAAGELQTVEKLYNIEHRSIKVTDQKRLWLKRDYKELLEYISEYMDISVSKASQRYGEISISVFETSDNPLNMRFYYSDQFGLQKTKSSM